MSKFTVSWAPRATEGSGVFVSVGAKAIGATADCTPGRSDGVEPVPKFVICVTVSALTPACVVAGRV